MGGMTKANQFDEVIDVLPTLSFRPIPKYAIYRKRDIAANRQPWQQRIVLKDEATIRTRASYRLSKAGYFAFIRHLQTS